MRKKCEPNCDLDNLEDREMSDIEYVSWYREGEHGCIVAVLTGMPEQNVRVGIGDTCLEAYEALQGTAIQCTGRDCGEAAALEWAVGAGWCESGLDEYEPDPDELTVGDDDDDDDTIAATIHEHGNGLVDVGDHVAGNDGELYEVVETGGIHCSPSGSGGGNYMHGRVRLADWDDLTEEEAEYVTCSAEVQS